ncbi:MAG: hypothetical protein PHV95_05290 [Eubacteriales bacterium]|nr:hypothetical protein [Eubacteriales bacterium]
MKKAKFYVLVFVIVSIVLSSCVSNPGDGSNGASQNISSQEESKALNLNDYLETLPDKDFDEYNFTVFMPLRFNNEYCAVYVQADELQSELLNDAAYERNQLLKEKYNINIKALEGGEPGGDVSIQLRTYIQSNGNDIDLVTPHASVGVASLMTDSLLYDLKNLPYVDYNMPWWNSDVNEALELGDKSYFVVNDITISNHSFQCIVFNKKMLEELQKPNLYELVYDDKWTIDEMLSVLKGVQNDTNGNSIDDDDDRWGVILPSALSQAVMYSSGVFPVTNNNGKPAVKFNDSKMNSLADSLLGAIADKSIKMVDYNDDKYDIFVNGNALMLVFNSTHYSILNEIEFDIGILPLPKYDEEQENYYSIVGAGLLGIPVNATAESIERTALIMEAMSAASYFKMRPAFVDTILYNRSLRDQDSQRMLDIIIESSVYNIGFNIDNQGNVGGFLQTILQSGSNTVASRSEAILESTQKFYDDLYNKALGID